MASQTSTIVRLRPTLPTETFDRDILIDPVVGGTIGVISAQTSTRDWFEFPRVYGQYSPQARIWRQDVESLAFDVWNGMAVTICACGGSVSGKTYTMRGPSDDPGIVPRVIEMLFHERQETDEVDLLALQVCCDGIYDLLKGKENDVQEPMELDAACKILDASQVSLLSACHAVDLLRHADDQLLDLKPRYKARIGPFMNLLRFRVARKRGDQTLVGTITLVETSDIAFLQVLGLSIRPLRHQRSDAGKRDYSTPRHHESKENLEALDTASVFGGLRYLLSSDVTLFICTVAPGLQSRASTLATLSFASNLLLGLEPTPASEALREDLDFRHPNTQRQPLSKQRYSPSNPDPTLECHKGARGPRPSDKRRDPGPARRMGSTEGHRGELPPSMEDSASASIHTLVAPVTPDLPTAIPSRNKRHTTTLESILQQIDTLEANWDQHRGSERTKKMVSIMLSAGKEYRKQGMHALALHMYTRAQSFFPEHAKLQARIAETRDLLAKGVAPGQEQS